MHKHLHCKLESIVILLWCPNLGGFNEFYFPFLYSSHTFPSTHFLSRIYFPSLSYSFSYHNSYLLYTNDRIYFGHPSLHWTNGRRYFRYSQYPTKNPTVVTITVFSSRRTSRRNKLAWIWTQPIKSLPDFVFPRGTSLVFATLHNEDIPNA
jgi:hypothetical protein